MIIYKNTTLKKKRVNSKKWSIAQVEFTEEKPITILESFTQKLVLTQYVNAPSVKEVEDFDKEHDMIVMTVLGQSARMYSFDFNELKELAKNAPVCSVTKKKVIVAHPYQCKEKEILCANSMITQ